VLRDEVERSYASLTSIVRNKEVCTGAAFFKYRHLDENSLANAILHWKVDLKDFPTIICGHSHEPRDHSRFLNSKAMLLPDTKDPNIFTRYMNTGSAGRFENLIWCIEVIGSTAHVYSWSNSGTASKIAMRKVRWDSDLKGNSSEMKWRSNSDQFSRHDRGGLS
jgi:hypothetical protein